MIDDFQPHEYGDNIAHALITALDIEGVADASVGEFPGSGLAEKLPYVSVELVDGVQDFFESNPVVDIDVFAGSRAEAKRVAAAIVMGFLRYPRSVQVKDVVVTIDSVSILTSPVKRPWEDSNIRRQSATIQFSVRR